jgi:hypothetical protein
MSHGLRIKKHIGLQSSIFWSCFILNRKSFQIERGKDRRG